jgi:hypothetical protein
MKHAFTSAALVLAALASYGQSTDSTSNTQADTIRIGSMTIIKKGGESGSSSETKKSDNYDWKWYSGKKSPKRVQTSWLNMDFGYSNFVDKTDYTSPEAKEYARVTQPGEPDFTASDFNLRSGKSTNFNLWFFRQRVGLTKDVKLNIRYGLMLETNNYRYENNISYVKGTRPYVFRDSIVFSKNKLAADYITVPFMLGYSPKPGNDGGFTLGLGVSMGYLYNSRNKQISDERGKQKTKGDFDLEVWKFQYIGEIGLGIVKLYFSYAPNSMYERGLVMKPYNIGIRFGEWY